MGAGVLRVQLNRLPQMKGRLLPIGSRGQQSTEIRIGIGIVRVDGQRSAEGCFSSFLIANLSQICPQIVLRVSEIRL